jgi:hypothetical protein
VLSVALFCGSFIGFGTSFGSDTTRSHWGMKHPNSVPLAVVKMLAYFNEFCASYLPWAPFPLALTVTSCTYTQVSPVGS